VCCMLSFLCVTDVRRRIGHATRSWRSTAPPCSALLCVSRCVIHASSSSLRHGSNAYASLLAEPSTHYCQQEGGQTNSAQLLATAFENCQTEYFSFIGRSQVIGAVLPSATVSQTRRLAVTARSNGGTVLLAFAGTPSCALLLVTKRHGTSTVSLELVHPSFRQVAARQTLQLQQP